MNGLLLCALNQWSRILVSTAQRLDAPWQYIKRWSPSVAIWLLLIYLSTSSCCSFSLGKDYGCLITMLWPKYNRRPSIDLYYKFCLNGPGNKLHFVNPNGIPHHYYFGLHCCDLFSYDHRKYLRSRYKSIITGWVIMRYASWCPNYESE